MKTLSESFRALPTLSTLAALLCLAPLRAQAQWEYETNNATITITGYTGPGGDVTIPDTIAGLPVTTIGDGAFVDCLLLTNVAIGTNLTTIEDFAFSYCTSLTTITLGNSLTTIGDSAFYVCSSLTTVTIPNSVTTIGYEAFAACASLASISIGNGLTTIGGWAFSLCTSLTNVAIGTNLTTIEDFAFCYCTSLTSVTVPNSVTSIGRAAFGGCTSLTAIRVDPLNPSYTSRDGALFNINQTMLVAFPGGKGPTYTIPDSVTTVGDRAFYGCSSLTTVTIPNSVTTIGGVAFGGCTSLTSVHFQGNAPALLGSGAWFDGTSAIIYYLPGTIGWGPAFAQRPTAPWLLPDPTILTLPPNFGLKTNHLRFRISWATNATVQVEAATTLTPPDWTPIATKTITMGVAQATDGWSDFFDPAPATPPTRFYRLRSP